MSKDDGFRGIVASKACFPSAKLSLSSLSIAVICSILISHPRHSSIVLEDVAGLAGVGRYEDVKRGNKEHVVLS